MSLLILLSSCKEEGPKDEDVALITARLYYEQLTSGKVKDFLAGMYHKDSISPSYEEQLEASMKMYLKQQRDEHQGIVSVKAVKAQRAEESGAVNAFLLLSYGDSTKEEVVVPMVKRRNLWLMK